MRLFVAAEPSAQVRQAAAGCAARLRARLEHQHAGTGIRCIPAASLHLTVWFLGEVSDARAQPVLDALAPPCAIPAFDLHVAGFGAFPPSGAPRVLWLGVTEGLEALAQAHEVIGCRLRPWGFPEEGRAYSAHVTIARLRDAPPHAVRTAIRHAVDHEPADAGGCRIDHLTVFRSRTLPTGAAYEPLLRVPLL